MLQPANIDIEVLKLAVKDVNKRWPDVKPELCLVLGSGWGDVVNAFDIKDSIPYEEITGIGKSGVAGHSGKLSLANYKDKNIFIFQGRRHWYEGEGWTPVVAPSYIAKHCGAEVMLLTNAAGGINYAPGDLMIVSDHINYMFSNPLIGPNHEKLGTRFPDMSYTYNKDLRDKIMAAGAETNVKLNSGVYLASSGPSYETPAEIRAFKTLGGDAVGMSTVPEAILGNSMGLKVVAISCISNYAAGISKAPLTHEEVGETMSSIMPTMVKLMPEIVKNILN
ncbi:MAG: purine-nucleoside phosphorylase [Victivallales bacterium]|nr:purine-nucleoside phosphorylase [Victivallales bacterium]